jgi:hypothetical protein
MGMGSMITTDERKAEVRKTIADAGLDWFRCEPGFRFLDADGDECIVIGWGGWREPDLLGALDLCPDEHHGHRRNHSLFTLQFKPATLVGAYSYKGEQCLMSIPDMEFLSCCKPAS